MSEIEKDVRKMDYVLTMELVKEKVRKEYDGEIVEKLILRLKYGNMFRMWSKCTECYRSVVGKGVVELPMESFGSEMSRSVDIIIFIPLESGSGGFKKGC